MESEEGKLTFQEVQAKIFEGMPERCRGCHSRDLGVLRLAEGVMNEEFTVQAAAETVRDDLARNCRLGTAVTGGCFGRVVCQYGKVSN